MPLYPFKCPACGDGREEVRPVAEHDQPTFCGCGERMCRVYEPLHVCVPMTGYYNYGLGCYVRNKQDVKDALRRERDGYTEAVEVRERGTNKLVRTKREHKGRELVEVGNERQDHIKPKHIDYTLPRGALDGMGLD